MDTGSLVGTTGVTLLLLGFVLNLLKKIRSDSVVYLLLNFTGAALAGISSYMIKFCPFVVLETVWVLASLLPLLKKLNT
jgi:hypothetical protein